MNLHLNLENSKLIFYFKGTINLKFLSKNILSKIQIRYIL